MIKPSTLDFLQELSQNNSKAWFDANRSRYDESKSNFREVVFNIFNEISLFDQNVIFSPDKIKFFRINRDIRFSKDKTPYKNHFSAYVSRGIGGLEGDYYIQVGANSQSFLAGGRYMPSKEDLESIRRFISEQFVEWEEFLTNETFEKVWKYQKTSWDDLKNAPRGFAKDDLAAKYLKVKRFVVNKNLSDQDLINGNFEKMSTSDFALLKNFLDFLDLAKNYQPKLDHYS